MLFGLLLGAIHLSFGAAIFSEMEGGMIRACLTLNVDSFELLMRSVRICLVTSACSIDKAVAHPAGPAPTMITLMPEFGVVMVWKGSPGGRDSHL